MKTKRPRLTGEERRTVARELARKYKTDRASVRDLADEFDLSYGTVRNLLQEEEVQLRARGGRRPRTQDG